MSVPNPPTVGTAPSPAPTTTDTVNFDARADAFHEFFPNWLNNLFPAVLAWIKARTEQVQTEAVASNNNATAAAASATAASTSKTAAASSQTAAALSAQAASTSATQSAASATTATSQATLATAAKTQAEAAAENAVAVVTGGTGSLTAEPGKLPLADAQGMLDESWRAALKGGDQVNDIGVPGTLGFGVGICPEPRSYYTPLPGSADRLQPNYGNYLHEDGSTVVWIPAFYIRRGHADNPTFGAYGDRSISIKALHTYPDEAAANSDDYYLHRAFVNAGQNQLGFWRDKYDCSLNGTVASSIQGVQPMVSGPVAEQVGFTGATANGQTPANIYGGAVAAAKSRGDAWFPESIFIASALSDISDAHAQAATSALHCAWWSAGNTNFPKGNNNNALRDGADLSVTFDSAGNTTHAAFALAGSGQPFAKTTHNGQANGISDVAGNIYKINPGLTCVAAAKAITDATQTNPVRLTIAAHGYTTGQPCLVLSMAGMTALNNRMFTLTVVDSDTISLDGVDGTAFPAWTSGGSVTTGRFFALKPSVDIATLQGGASTATDFWGAAGIAANYDEITINLRTDYPNNTVAQRYGNGGNQVFAWDTPASRLQSMLGMPAVGGVSPAGTAEMGNDFFIQYFRDQLCVSSRGDWYTGSDSGSRFRYLINTRANAQANVGFAATRYS